MIIINKKTEKRTKLHAFNCPECGVDFGSYRNTSIFCSRKCSQKSQTKTKLRGETRICKKCGNEFYSKRSYDRRGYKRQFCSMVCTKNDISVPLGKFISYDGYWIVDNNKREHRLIYERFFGKIPCLKCTVLQTQGLSPLPCCPSATC